MSENDKNKKSGYDLMQDTQYLLLGLDDAESESFDLAEILAEFGSEGSVPPKQSEPERSDETPRKEECEPEDHPKIIAFPGAAPVEEPAEEEETIVLSDMGGEEADFSPEELFRVEHEEAHPVDYSELVDLPVLQEEPPEDPSEPRPLSMEDIVASTVDAVKAENERDQSEQRKRIEKARKKQERKKREPRTNAPLPEMAEEPSPRTWRRSTSAAIWAAKTVSFLPSRC